MESKVISYMACAKCIPKLTFNKKNPNRIFTIILSHFSCIISKQQWTFTIGKGGLLLKHTNSFAKVCQNLRNTNQKFVGIVYSVMPLLFNTCDFCSIFAWQKYVMSVLYGMDDKMIYIVVISHVNGSQKQSCVEPFHSSCTGSLYQ